METFNEKIKRIRKSLGLNQTDVCSKIGITQPSFASIEAGRTKSISIELGKKIADALSISFNELFEIENGSLKENLTDITDQLKNRITELEEQLNDKRTIIDFLSAQELLNITASKLYNDEKPRPRFPDFNDLDALIKEINERPFDSGDNESMIKYILYRLNEIKKLNKE